MGGRLLQRIATPLRGRRSTLQRFADETRTDERTGAVRSVQRGELLLGESALAELWSPQGLERLARTYWRFLARATLGLVHVHYGKDERAVVLIAPPLRLLAFHAPDYELSADRGLVRWRIKRGLLVAGGAQGARDEGHLQIEVQRRPAGQGQERLVVRVEVANFYPAIALRVSRRLYNATQSRIHVLVTRAFLRSLARLKGESGRVPLAISRVGRFAQRH
ncbi:MAG TPA: hypothetical protein VKU89_06175 [Solirubrobacteraceae bacterium]|nr:hypothetical protein [Solirubrobacteraceae bacterium]